MKQFACRITTFNPCKNHSIAAWIGSCASVVHTCVLVWTMQPFYMFRRCSPSRTSFLTSRYTIRYGLLHHTYNLDEVFGLYLNETLLSVAMQQAGYATAAIGKMHIGSSHWGMTPPGRSFDYAPAYFLGGEEDYYTHVTSQGKAKGIDARNWTSPAPVTGEYSAFTYARGAREAIEAHKSSGSDRPMFMYYACQDNHAPQEPPAGYPNASIPDKNRRAFSGMVRAVDEQLANVTSALEEAGYLNDTLIIFTNENPAPTPPTGPNATFTAIGGSNYPQRGSKHTLWGDGLAFVWGAGVPARARGQETGALMHAVDLFQLAVEAAGAGNRSSGFPLDGAAPSRVWSAVAGLATSRDAVRNETLLNYDPLATPGPRGCCGYAGLVWVQSKSDGRSESGGPSSDPSTSTGTRQWKLLIDPGEPDGWYPPGSSSSVPPSEAGLGPDPFSMDAAGAAGVMSVNLGRKRQRYPDPSIPTGPAALREFRECSAAVVERVTSDGAEISANLAARVDRECNALRQLDSWDLLHRERSIRWGEWGQRLVQEVRGQPEGRGQFPASSSSSSPLVGSDGFVRLGPDARITYLFDVTSDPYQEKDVILQYPEVAQRMLARLDEYIDQSLPDGHGPTVPESNPDNHNGYWTPWMGQKPSEKAAV